MIFAAALPMQKWIAGDVIPAIRKTGSYSAIQSIPDFSNPAEAARAWAEQYESAQLAIETKASDF